MTKKSPDKKEQKRLKKIEDAKQSRRYRAAEMVKGGYSCRGAAKILGVSPQFVSYWSRRLLEIGKELRKVGGAARWVRTFKFKEGFRGLLASRKPGPEPGNCPKS
jgi:hypothetical protein